jgi:hypothetical protein
MAQSIPRVPLGSDIKHHKNFWWNDSSPLICGDFGIQFKYGWVRVFLDDIEPIVFDILRGEAAGNKRLNDYETEQRLLRFDHENCLYQVLPTAKQPLFSLWVLHLIDKHPSGIELLAAINFFSNPIDELVSVPRCPQRVRVL